MSRWANLGSFISFLVVFGLLDSNAARAAQHASPKTEKTVLPPIAAGSTGPIPQVPLDATPALLPEVTYRSGQLTIVAANSTLSDILVAVHQLTGADIAIPVAPDRVVVRLGPGSAADVLSALLTGSHFNFVLMSSPTAPHVLKRVVLLAEPKDDDRTRPAFVNTVATPALSKQAAPLSQSSAPNQTLQDQPEEPQGMLETPDEL
jgi:hypothetical protein